MILRGVGVALLGFVAAGASAAEVIPAAPASYFNDYASVVSPATASSLNSKLQQFERDTSNQVVVAIYPTMQRDSSVEDYTVRVAQSWHPGTKGLSNGAVLFIFVNSHQIYLQVGYGLEATLTDALSKRIISDEIAPAFRRGDFGAGVTAGVNAIIAATRGEYRGTGHTVTEGRDQGTFSFGFFFVLLLVIIFIISSIRRKRGASTTTAAAGVTRRLHADHIPGRRRRLWRWRRIWRRRRGRLLGRRRRASGAAAQGGSW